MKCGCRESRQIFFCLKQKSSSEFGLLNESVYFRFLKIISNVRKHHAHFKRCIDILSEIVFLFINSKFINNSGFWYENFRKVENFLTNHVTIRLREEKNKR